MVMLKIGDQELQEAVLEYNHLFSINDEERGEIDLIQLSIDMGDTS